MGAGEATAEIPCEHIPAKETGSKVGWGECVGKRPLCHCHRNRRVAPGLFTVLIPLGSEPAAVNTHVPHGAMLKKEKTSPVLLSATGNTYAQSKFYINKNYLYESQCVKC